MSAPVKKVHTLKALLVEDEKYGGYTAHFEGYPQAIAEGETIEEALDNLKSVFVHMVRHKLSIPEGSLPIIGQTPADKYISRDVAVMA